jgi:hypothetical protein
MDLNNKDYDPHSFIDWLINDIYKVKNDAALAAKLEMSPVQISKIRHRVFPVGCNMLIAIHEDTGMRTLDIKKRMSRMYNACNIKLAA